MTFMNRSNNLWAIVCMLAIAITAGSYIADYDGEVHDMATAAVPTAAPTQFRGNLSSTEISVLVDFYQSFRGNSWYWQNASYGEVWDINNPAANPCQSRWQGIVCKCSYSLNQCSLSEINLPNYGLDGSFPASFANLTQLTVLNLTDNFIVDSLPVDWAPTTLQILDVSYNAMDGTLPTYLWSNTNLQQLRLHYNSFRGDLSSNIGRLKSLSYLTLGKNLFSGTLPHSLSSLRMLRVFLIKDNQFIGELSNITWSNLVRLRALDIRENRFYGTIPQSLKELNGLVSFHVGNNHFHGSLPLLSSVILQQYGVSRNNFTGTVVPGILNRAQLRLVDISLNKLTGTIPNITMVTSLTEFIAGNNTFTGPLPEGLFHQPDLQLLMLDFNNLNGTLSPNLCRLTQLRLFSVDGNALSGTLPPSLVSLKQLEHFVVSDNHLTGTLPEAVGNWTAMKWLSLSFNHFTGTLPSSIGQLSNLTNFYVTKNHFNGTLPRSLGDLLSLKFLFLEYNQFSGSVPVSLSALKKLEGITMNNNVLTGHPYDAFIGFPAVFYLIMGYNYLSGPLPINIDWRRMLFYTAEYNLFTGSIPFKRAQTKYLFYADFGYNYLTGTLPHWLDEKAINYFYADYTLLHGTIPPLSPNLVELWCEGATLTGSIPASIRNCTSLEVLRLNYNHLRGTIPAALAKLPKLQTLFLHQNHLAGGLSHVFVDPEPHTLVHVDVSNNQLTGTLPPALFNSTMMQSFAASSNCFSGSIPSEICIAEHLVALSIDGLATASHCRDNIQAIPGLQSFLLKNQFVGGIPACIFHLPHLQSLHVSGNELSGTLEATLVVSPSLVNLSISNNKFSGSIPLAIQQHRFTNLDVSYNKFSGTLVAQGTPILPTNASFYAQRNRLSGTIPAHLMETRNISILDGNLFACDMLTRHLPRHDPKYASYNCGSNEVNLSLLVWAWLWPIFVGCVFVTYQAAQRSWAKIQQRAARLAQQEHDFQQEAVSMEQVETGVSHHRIVTKVTGRIRVERKTPSSSASASASSASSSFWQRWWPAQSTTTTTTATATPNATSAGSGSGGSGSGGGGGGGDASRTVSVPQLELQTMSTLSPLHGAAAASASRRRRHGSSADDDYDDDGDDDHDATDNGRNKPATATAAATAAAAPMPRLSAAHRPSAAHRASTHRPSATQRLSTAPRPSAYRPSATQRPSTAAAYGGADHHHHHDDEDKQRTESTVVAAEIQRLYNLDSALPQNHTAAAQTSMTVWETIRHLRDRMHRWRYATIDHEAPDNQQDMLSSLHVMRRVCTTLTVCCLVLLLPIYAGISTRYSSYHDVYIWTVSALIMRGIAPAIVLLFIFCGVMLLTWVLIQRERLTLFEALEQDGPLSQGLFYVAFLLLDIVIMLIVNVGYIFAVEQVGPSSLIFVESAVAIVKVLWNEFVVIRCFKPFKYMFFVYGLGWRETAQVHRPTLYDFVTQNAIIILNLVVLPIAAIAFASTNCLYNLVDPPPTVESGFQIEVCAISIPIGTRLLCVDYINSYKTISYAPPFIYSNQCSSFIVINYASVYIYFMIIVSFVLPLCKAWLKVYTDRISPASPWKQRLLRVLPRALHTPQPAPTATSQTPDKPIFEKRILPIRLISYLSLLLIFGVTFPPMALTVFMGIWIVIRFEELVIGKLLYEAESVGYHWYRHRIREENNEALRYVTNPVLVWFMLSSVSLIYAYLVFDVLTDTPQVTYHDAIAPVVFIVTFPTLIFVVTICWKLWTNQQLVREREALRRREGDITWLMRSSQRGSETIVLEMQALPSAATAGGGGGGGSGGGGTGPLRSSDIYGLDRDSDMSTT